VDTGTGEFRISALQMEELERQNLHADLLTFLKSSNLNNTESNLMRFLRSYSGSQSGQTLSMAVSQLETDAREQILDEFHLELGTSRFNFKNIAFDSIAAVERQMKFSVKMAQFGWLHNPTLSSTLRFAIIRYERFFRLMKAAYGIVPTLDVDLVWHTHQLCPRRYSAYCKHHKGGLVDHNDKVGSEILHNGFEKTQALYQSKFGEEYLICHGWRCELNRLSADNEVDPETYAKLDSIIDQENQRRKDSHIEILLDYARCHNGCLHEAGANCNTQCTSNCGQDCTGNCHQGCSSDCCGNGCSSGCGGF
jgi:hypothetical protein